VRKPRLWIHVVSLGGCAGTCLCFMALGKPELASLTFFTCEDTTETVEYMVELLLVQGGKYTMILPPPRRPAQ
jgi:hypothetical protein